MVIKGLVRDALGTLENKAEDAYTALTGEKATITLGSNRFDDHQGPGIVPFDSDSTQYTGGSYGGSQHTGLYGGYSNPGSVNPSMQPHSYGTTTGGQTYAGQPQQQQMLTQLQSFASVPEKFMPATPSSSQQTPYLSPGQVSHRQHQSPQMGQYQHYTQPAQNQGYQWPQNQQYHNSYGQSPPPAGGYPVASPVHRSPPGEYFQGNQSLYGTTAPPVRYLDQHAPSSSQSTPIGEWNPNANGPNSWNAFTGGK